ncbi:hypothetical protein ACHAWF_008345 [Thalassiosira exigua]
MSNLGANEEKGDVLDTHIYNSNGGFLIMPQHKMLATHARQASELGMLSNGLANAQDFLHLAAHHVSNLCVAKQERLIANKF